MRQRLLKSKTRVVERNVIILYRFYKSEIYIDLNVRQASEVAQFLILSVTAHNNEFMFSPINE